MVDDYRAALDEGGHKHFRWQKEPDFSMFVDWSPYLNKKWHNGYDTRIDIDRLKALGRAITTVPEGFSVQRQVNKIYSDRQQMIEGEIPVDWGCAEALAYASLVNSGYSVRLTGQDVGRGTFSHRHAALYSQTDGERYIPLQHINAEQPDFELFDSLLSEVAVLGFEYGYSSTNPNAMVIWEAQFGDFANGAQVVIDQFISSSEAKWQRYCGLVMLLPHGYDGQGPEHSSARLERYLQLCAEDNMQVCVPSTPAQIYHVLRRQMVRDYRKPLIIMSPKSLLRHKRCVSEFGEFTDAPFQPVIDEIDPNITPEKVERILFCSGKVYYDLIDAREQHEIDNIAIIRLEQLYPYPHDEIEEILKRYPHVEQRVWVQEEPRNQGAWWYIRAHMDVNLSHKDNRIEYAGRPASASPAVGYLQIHRQQLQAFLNDALQLDKDNK
jgi:2-oxoglutarate dehydrogenase E1 component